jgi:hypothetical protein
VIDPSSQQTDPRRPAATTRTSSGIAANIPACITWLPCQIAVSGEGAQNLPGGVTLAVSKDLIKDAPSIDADGQTDASEQDALYPRDAGHA